MSSKPKAVQRVREAKTKDPIPLDRKCLLKAVDCVLKNRDEKKVQRKIVQDYGELAASGVISVCLSHSTEILCKTAALQKLHCNVKDLLDELRKAIIMHKWSYCTRLIILLLENKQSNRITLLGIIKTCVTILLATNASSDNIKEFCTVCLGISDDRKINKFCKQCFEINPELNSDDVDERIEPIATRSRKRKNK